MDVLHIFKERLAKGEAVYGPFMKATDAAFVECSGYAGFDFVILDMEHGPVGFSGLQHLVRAAEVSDVISVVRTYDSLEMTIGKALDLGAKGIQVPQVRSASEAREVVKAARFFPDGERGVCRFVRAARYSAIPRDVYFKKANRSLVILQIEGTQAIDELDEILRVEGFDILFVGPYDLSQSLGVPGQVSHPSVIKAIEDITGKARAAGVVLGVFCDTPESAALWRKAGIQYISYSVDVGIYMEACISIIHKLKHENHE